VPELEGDEHALEGPKQEERKNERQGAPDNGVQPVRRLVEHFDQERRADDDKAGDEDDEDRGPIAGIGEAVVEAADLAAGREGQVAVIQLALVASGTATDET